MSKKARIYSKSTLQALKLFASLIKVARKKHGWSETELAERAGNHTAHHTQDRASQSGIRDRTLLRGCPSSWNPPAFI